MSSPSGRMSVSSRAAVIADALGRLEKIYVGQEKANEADQAEVEGQRQQEEQARKLKEEKVQDVQAKDVEDVAAGRPASSLKALITHYGANELADINVQFERNKFYQIARVKVAQVGEDFVLTSWEARHSVGGDFHNLVTEDKPFAVLTFKNAHALDEFNLTPGSYIHAVGQFLKFSAFDMAGGYSERLPVFECVGLEVNGSFIDTR